MSPGSQNPLRLSRQASKPTSAPVSRAHWQEIKPPGREEDISLGSFANSRGLFHQTLTNHQQSMASQHQMALHEINQAFANNTVPAAVISSSVVPASVDKNTTQNGALQSLAQDRDISGRMCKQNTANGIVEKMDSGDVVRGCSGTGVMSPDSIMSADSLGNVAANPRFPRCEEVGRDGVEATMSAVTSSAIPDGVKEKSSQNGGSSDVKGNSPTSTGGVMLLESSQTRPADQNQNVPSRVTTNHSRVEADMTDISGQSDGNRGNVMVEENGAACSKGLSPSFFLHRNVPSPNVAIVQPSVHPAPYQQVNDSSKHLTTDTQMECSPQEQKTHSCLDTRAAVGIYLQPSVGFVSTCPGVVQTHSSPPNTMDILPPGNDEVFPPTKPPETYRKSSFSEPATSLGTIFAIPPSYAPPPISFQPEEFLNHNSGFPADKFPVLDFPMATCIKDNIAYEEIPVDDTSSVSSITSDIAATNALAGQQDF